MEGSTKHHQSTSHSQEDDDDDDLDDAGQPTEFCQLFSNQEANSAEYREKHTQYILKFFTNPLQLASASIRGSVHFVHFKIVSIFGISWPNPLPILKICMSIDSSSFNDYTFEKIFTRSRSIRTPRAPQCF